MVLVTGSDTVWHTLNKVNKHKQIQLRESGACTDHSDWGSGLLFSCWMVLNAARLHDVMESWLSSGKFSLILFGLSAGGCVEVMWGLKAGRWLIGHFLSPFFYFLLLFVQKSGRNYEDTEVLHIEITEIKAKYQLWQQFSGEISFSPVLLTRVTWIESVAELQFCFTFDFFYGSIYPKISINQCMKNPMFLPAVSVQTKKNKII